MRFSLSIAIVAMVNSTALRELHSPDTQQNLILFKSDICPHDQTPHEAIDLKLNLFHVNSSFLPVKNRAQSPHSNYIGEMNGAKNASSASTSPHDYDDLSEVTEGIQLIANSFEENEEKGEFAWSEADQGVILGSFFWGYVLTQIPGGWISQKIGGKWPFGLGLLITGLFAILIPTAARLGGMHFLIFVRIVQGLAGGVTVPSMQAMISQWIPPEERGKLGSFAFAGMPFGSFISMLVSGFLINYFGWPSVFYATGALTALWFSLWSYFTHAFPIDDPTISQDELHYIQRALHAHSNPKQQSNQQFKQKLQVPWTRVLLSAPFWAILICNTCETWGLYTIMTELPTYMKTVLHFDIKQNSLMSAFPHLLTLIVSIILSNVGDNLIEREYLSIGAVRKLCTSIALWGYAAALLGVAYSGCDRVKTVTLLGVAIAANGGKFCGFLVNIIDLTPNYVGILMGIINTISSMPGFFAPWVAGMIINDNPSLENWRLVFLIVAAISFCGNLVYILFASGEEQSWNRGEDSERAPSSSSTFSLECIAPAILMEKIARNIEMGPYIIPENIAEVPRLQPVPVVPNAGENSDEKNGHRCSA
ncbi:unnamed protein product [Orchesella dallaii]|uniref:Major facilitator superfamily (MFS) profile domain-containing protein n=1 Tax=Orchesella dallaii TaxID=48710 RepID=A0ABP1RAU7_9HEXA